VRLINDSFDQLCSLNEKSGATVGIFPGAFKPPHRGHYATAAAACEACDKVYIFMSPKARMLRQPSKDTGVPEWQKFEGLLNKPRPGITIELEEVDRQTSASEARQKILDASLGRRDMESFTNNIETYLPDLQPMQKRRVVQELMSKSVTDGQITAIEAGNIWKVYVQQLERDFRMQGSIIFETVQVSPIVSSYDLVDKELVPSGFTGTVKLYTGT